MKHKLPVLFIIIAFTSVCFISNASACTVFSATDGNNVLFGNNEDWLEKDTFIWFVPAPEGHYGKVCLGFENAHPQGGMNTAGLAIDWVAFKDASAQNLAPALPGKENFIGDMNFALLDTCATVEDVIKFYQRYNDPNVGYASLYAADKTGASAIIGWDVVAGDVKVERGPGFQALGFGATSILPELGKKGPVTEEVFRGMLDTAKNPDMTLYSNIFNLKTGAITLYNCHNYGEVVKFDLKTELQNSPHLYRIPELFKTQGSIGRDVLNPEMLLPLGLRIVIYAFAALEILAALLLIISVFSCKSPTPFKTAARIIGILACVTALVVLYFAYYRFLFIQNYGFTLLGLADLPWIFYEFVFAEAVICAVCIWRRIFEAPGRVLYTAAAALNLLLAAGIMIAF